MAPHYSKISIIQRITMFRSAYPIKLVHLKMKFSNIPIVHIILMDTIDMNKLLLRAKIID